LCLLAFRNWPWSGVTALTQALTLAYVNLPFFLVQASGGGGRGCLCLERDQRAAVENAAVAMSSWFGWEPPEISEPVAALTLYPLAGDLALPAEVLSGLAEAGQGLLALGTSRAALTLVVRESALAAVVEALGRRLELPAGASPPEERVKVVQSTIWRGN
jgi:hypothetical protein